MTIHHGAGATSRTGAIATASAGLVAAFGIRVGAVEDVPDAATDWAAHGEALTAAGATPRGDVLAGLRAAAHALTAVTSGVLQLDGPEQLSMRERLSTVRHVPQPGRTLRDGGRLLRARDGWLALNLPRPSDTDALAALTGDRVRDLDWPALAEWSRSQATSDVVETATLLGLAASAVPGGVRPVGPVPWVLHGTWGRRRQDTPRVADLTALWAGPLAGRLLGTWGADVVKIENITRAEHPLAADREFTAMLGAGKRLHRIDFAQLDELHEAVASADVVLFSARPRALEGLGLRPRPDQIWVLISGHGHGGEDGLRVGFGDDAAAAAGVVADLDGDPVFAADALADPVTGVLAAVAAVGCWRAGFAGRIDLALTRGAAWAASATAPHG